MVKVLIVEDEAITALELEYHLQQLGYQVVDKVVSGEQAVRRASALRPDLILMDVHLEGTMDGIEAAQLIRESQDVPVVFLTAFGDEQTLNRANATGPFGYVIKPFQESELRANIEVALSKYRSHRLLRRDRDNLQLLLDGLRIGTVITDADGRIVFVSQVARRLLGINESDALGLMWDRVLPFQSETISRVRAKFDSEDGTSTRIPTRISLDHGQSYHMELDIRRDPQEKRRRLFVFYDVTKVHDLRRQLARQNKGGDIIGDSEPMNRIFDQIKSAARFDSTVLIEGETGTGKELVARAIHDASARASKPFVAVNCGALTESLVASQLFGHKRGSFTGAISDEPGYFGAANGGTLFLDEIGDIPLDIQVNLLRVLEERTVTRVGETKARKVDVRIVAASHRHLPTEVENGTFRQDLLFRIRVARLELPPLRERRSDIPLLAYHFLSGLSAKSGVEIDTLGESAVRCMLEYNWPGNVRELANAIEYAMIHTPGSIIEANSLPPEVRTSVAADLLPDGLPDDERDRILAALRHTEGNRKAAAKLLGISRATFYRRLTEFKLDQV